MNHIGRRRLLKLADFLDKLPREKFVFSAFVVQHGKPMKEALRAGHLDCGTVGCAIGWMPALFPRQLRWIANSDGKQIAAEDKKTGRYNFDMAEAFFGLTANEVYKLFDPDYSKLGRNATPEQVANGIRKFVESH